MRALLKYKFNFLRKLFFWQSVNRHIYTWYYLKNSSARINIWFLLLGIELEIFFWQCRPHTVVQCMQENITFICISSQWEEYIDNDARYFSVQVQETLCLFTVCLKGQCHEIFDFWFFMNPQASKYTIRAVSNFFKNSPRYSHLKMHHRCRWHHWQMEKNHCLPACLSACLPACLPICLLNYHCYQTNLICPLLSP